MTHSERQLVDLYLDGVLPESEHALLFQRLETDPEALVYLASRTQLNLDLRRSFKRRKLQQMAVAGAATSLVHQPCSVWLSWRPLTAAAAGIVFGMFCASLAWAVASPSAMATVSRLFALVDGSFEKTGGRVASGFPSEFGKWSGDEAEVAAGEAKDGRQALRFVRAEGDAAVANSPANSCDVYQLVDLRSLKTDAAGGEATLEMSAQFLDARSAKGADVTFTCRLYVFSGSPESLRGEWPLTRKEAMAAGSGTVQSTGGAPQTWRSVTAKVLLPAQADFAVVQLVAGKGPASDNKAAEFGEQFADDVRLTLKTQPTLPVRIAQR